MTEEEMRARITELEEENKKLQENYNTVSEQIKTKEEQISSLNNSVTELKNKNYDLFMKVQSQPIEHTKQESKTQDTEIKVDDVINKLMGGN